MKNRELDNKILGLVAAATMCMGVTACAGEEGSPDDESERSGLLFGLQDEDVVQLHERYLGDEDVQLTVDRLSAPFDCSLYDDLCEQIGRDRAIEFTSDLVDLGLDGASDEEVRSFIDQRLDEGMDLLIEEEDAAADSDELHFRLATSWYSRTTGNYRTLTRNGVTTPVIGSRQAWTELKTQRKNAWGTWISKKANEICVNTGTNTQVVTVCGGGIPCSNDTIESFNPGNVCASDVKNHKSRTYHQRNNGSEPGGGFSISYKVTADGCADAEISGINFASTCPPTITGWY